MMKQQILIVEDDVENLAGLKMLVTKYQPDSMIFEAEDAKSARHILHNQKINLMFLDIQLPGEDGLTFLSSVKHDYPHLRTVVVSAYGTFFYAQKAIRLNVDEYLLKPYAPDDIERILRQTDIRDEDDGILTEPLRSLFQRWLEGENSLNDSLLEHKKLADLQGKPVQLILLRPLLRENPEEHNYFRSNAEHCARMISKYWKSRQEERLLIFPMNEQIVGIVFLQKVHPEIKELDSDTLENLMSFSSVSFSCIQSPIPAGSWYQIPAVYRKIERMASVLFFRPPFSVLHAEDGFSRRSQISYDFCLSEFIKNHRKAFLESDWADQVEAFLSIILSETGENLQAFLYSVHKSLSEYVEECSEYLTKSEYHHFKNSIMNLTDNCTHIDAFRSGLAALLNDMDGVIAERRADLHQMIGAQMIEYVQQHSSQADFTKDKAAEFFGFTPDYFGVLFKKATGKTFIEEGNEERIQQAKALLKTTRMKVYQISQAVGISDEKYFHRLFIRYTGMTPNRFRNGHTSNE